jgi:hypothetical protein
MFEDYLRDVRFQSSACREPRTARNASSLSAVASTSRFRSPSGRVTAIVGTAPDLKTNGAAEGDQAEAMHLAADRQRNIDRSSMRMSEKGP